MNPQRIRMSRAKGWRKPANTVYVGRPSKWGNPWRAKEANGAIVYQIFSQELRECVAAPAAHPHAMEIRIIAESIHELRGKNLACWCPLDQLCHADVLLELANQ